MTTTLRHVLALGCLAGLIGCSDTAPPPSTQAQKTDAAKLATYCALDHAEKLATQAGRPDVLGRRAVQACQDEISHAALVYADNDPRRASELMSGFEQTTAEAAARHIERLRAQK